MPEDRVGERLDQVVRLVVAKGVGGGDEGGSFNVSCCMLKYIVIVNCQVMLVRRRRRRRRKISAHLIRCRGVFTEAPSSIQAVMGHSVMVLKSSVAVWGRH